MKKIDTIGFGPNDTSKGINQALMKKINLTTTINNEWRKRIEDDPEFERNHTFMEFKKQWLRQNKRKRK